MTRVPLFATVSVVCCALMQHFAVTEAYILTSSTPAPTTQVIQTSQGYAAPRPGCGGQLTGSHGVISSPNYPNYYANFLNCVWTIQVPAGQRVTIVFHSLYLESCCDFVQMRDGLLSMSPALGGRYSGTSVPPTTTSRSNALRLEFDTDYSVGGPGFSASYYSQASNGSEDEHITTVNTANRSQTSAPSSVPPSGEYVTTSNPARTTHIIEQTSQRNAVPLSVCGGELTGPSGVISSPNYPSYYANFLNCVWTIHVPAGQRVTIVFHILNLETCCDFLQMRDGLLSTSPGLGGRYSGTDVPPPTTSRSNALRLEFDTDYSGVGPGFWASYYSQASNSTAGEYVTTSNPASTTHIMIEQTSQRYAVPLSESGTISYQNATSTTVTASPITSADAAHITSAHATTVTYKEDSAQTTHALDPALQDNTTPHTVTSADTPQTTTFVRTIVLIHKTTQPGEYLFLRGGIDHSYREGCTDDASVSPCAISISHSSLGDGSHYEKYNSWRLGNTKLNWYGAQAYQTTYYEQPAQGSPAVWTTNVMGDAGYQSINSYGRHYWLLDVQMDCSQTVDGWFEVKAFITGVTTETGYWESDIDQAATCAGDAGGSKPYSTANHFARCGFVNVFEFGSGSCQIENF